MRRLTIKQRRFIDETIKTNNPTQAVMKVYNVKDNNSARSIASNNLTKVSIRKSIDEHLREAGYNPHNSIKSLLKNEEVGAGVKATASDSIRASELLLKLSGDLIDRKQTSTLNVNIDNLPKDKLLELKDKYDKILNNK